VGRLSPFTKQPDAVSIPIFEDLGQIMAQNATIYKVELSVSDMDRRWCREVGGNLKAA
jgi:hypothetical protein